MLRMLYNYSKSLFGTILGFKKLNRFSLIYLHQSQDANRSARSSEGILGSLHVLATFFVAPT